jgi:simple sugar transport system ATP-binding protein
VSENIALGLHPLPFFSPLRTIEERVREFSERYSLMVDPKARVWQLSVGERQRVEIIKVLMRGARTLILDEPTSVLSPDEIAVLFHILGTMKSEGKAIVFITHKLGEVLETADRITILRRGRVTARMEAPRLQGTRATGAAAEGCGGDDGGEGVAGLDTKKDLDIENDLDSKNDLKLKKDLDLKKDLACKMVGREVILSIARETVDRGETILRADSLRVIGDRGRETVRGVSFSVRRGEVFGVVGVAGNGQRELAEAVAGLRPAAGGMVRLEGNVGYIPEDRLRMGSVPDLTVAENSILTRYRERPFSKGPFLDLASIREWAGALSSRFKVVVSDLNSPARQLSGGNLQRLILARELSGSASLLVAEQPTHGLDVGSTEDIWRELLAQRRNGAVLLVSGDLGEALELCDRIGVMYKGKMTVIDGPFSDEKVKEIGIRMAGVEE